MRQPILLALTLTAVAPVIYLSNAAYAQTRIRDLQSIARGVTVSGNVTQVVGNSFVLDDGSGQLVVDAGPRWRQPITLTPGERVTVRGEVGRSGEFDAFSITRSNGTVINIRPAEGPPPWAGGPHRRRDRPGR
ncbi:MAG: DNA-binding protein [Leptolyngbyaceae cyanobacterium RU_5_1]|nr:DNA-binding protein [Leptolyngbyaceae cyanobacterium RU_5_1]